MPYNDPLTPAQIVAALQAIARADAADLALAGVLVDSAPIARLAAAYDARSHIAALPPLPPPPNPSAPLFALMNLR